MFALRRWKDSGHPAEHFDETHAYRPADYVTEATRDGRSVLLDLRTERYYGLDEVGSAIWAGVREGLTAPEIVDRLEAEYDVPRSTLETDTSVFLARLVDSKLVAGA